MNLRSLLAVVVTVAILLPPPAGASVVCGRKNRATGELAEGANLRVRSSCKANEVVADPDALGFRGSQGDPGMVGPPGPTGPGGPGAVVKDANGVIVGRAARAENGESPVYALSQLASGGAPFVVRVDDSQALSCYDVQVFFASSDCSGPILVQSPFPDFSSPTFLTRWCANGPTPSTVYVPTSPGVDQPYRSRRSRTGGCNTGTGEARLTPDFEVVTFTPPFTLEVQ